MLRELRVLRMSRGSEARKYDRDTASDSFTPVQSCLGGHEEALNGLRVADAARLPGDYACSVKQNFCGSSLSNAARPLRSELIM